MFEVNNEIKVFNRADHKLLATWSIAEQGKKMVDDMAFDSASRRIYFAASQFIDVFQQRDPDHYEQIGHIPTSFRAKTAILVPELKLYYLAVPHHEKQMAEVRVYKVIP